MERLSTSRTRSCFVVTRLGGENTDARKQANLVYENLICPALEGLKFSIARSDRIRGSGNIVQEILALLQSADVCVVDLTGDNPNVYYECGRRHESSKPFVLIKDIRERGRLPFDVAPLRTLFYDPRSLKSLAQTVDELRSNIKTVLPSYMTADFGSGPVPEVRRIDPGTFYIGSRKEEPGHSRLSAGRHRVKIRNPFHMGVYPVTFDEYDFYCDENPSVRRPKDDHGRGRHPVTNVDWHEAVAYCNWLQNRTGRAYRLPSEAEWEYVCRAGTTSAFSCGESLVRANYDRDPLHGGTRPVDELRGKNVWGIYQMHGNVWEWTMDDWFEGYVQSRGPRFEEPRLHENTLGPTSKGKAVRGGSWYESANYCRSASRVRYPSVARTSYIGFRVAMGDLLPDEDQP